MNYFESNTDIEQELGEILSSKSFLKDMVKLGELEKISNNYSSDVYRLCRNSIGWVLKKLKESYYIFDLEIVEGLFKGKDHAWIKIGDYNVDLTLAQFVDCPNLAISKVENESKIGYEPIKIMNVKDWLRCV